LTYLRIEQVAERIAYCILLCLAPEPKLSLSTRTAAVRVETFFFVSMLLPNEARFSMILRVRGRVIVKASKNGWRAMRQGADTAWRTLD